MSLLRIKIDLFGLHGNVQDHLEKIKKIIIKEYPNQKDLEICCTEHSNHLECFSEECQELHNP